MGEKLIKPYEISVWEDKLTQIENSNPAEYEFKETKLAIIGSDTMTGFNKVYNPVFNKKTNGEKTLSFSLKYKYFDPYSGNEGVVNPFAALLINERKVKLHYDNKWYEFIIKDHSESSDGLEWTYTCTDAFVLELSKTGYNITFDSELNNNYGTATELATEALKNTEWQVGDSDSLKQLVAEPIYKAQLVGNTTIINASGTQEQAPTPTTDIYLFYSYIKNQSGKYVQFIIRDRNRQYTIDDNNVITDTNFRITEDLTFKDNSFVNESGTTIITIEEAETKYQANRLVYNQLSTYDPIMEKMVDRFKVEDTNTEVYKYTQSMYTTSNVVMNYIVNGDNFNALEDGSLQGWNPYTDQSPDMTQEPDETTGLYPPQKVNKLELVTKPELGTNKELANIDTLAQIEGFLKVRFNGTIEEDQEKIYNTVHNNGLESYASSIESIAAGQKFVFRWRAGVGDFNSLTPTQSLGLLVAKYTQDTPTKYGYYYKHIKPEDVIMRFEPSATNEPKELNNIITGGTLVEQQVEINGTLEGNGVYDYIIDGVAQSLSTKYIYVDNDIEYVWTGQTQTEEPIEGAKGGFIPKDASNYLPYYYITATADKSVPNSVFADSTQKIGIFIYGLDDIGITESKTITKDNSNLDVLPLTANEQLSVKNNTSITVSYTAKSGNVYSFEFTAGVTNNESENCQYNAKTDVITIKTQTGIRNYTINYTDIAPVYIQDIQLMRFVADAADPSGETPILMGNVPEATVVSTEYYYIKPEKGTAAEDIQTYISLEELSKQTGVGQSIVPMYNEDSEKYSSISVAQSNCFDILQTIAETFECWVDLVVDHEPDTGYIIPGSKRVYLREYVGKDNYAGFKYGINLDTIERTVNSDEIVTKLIVDSSQSDLVDEGYVSITNAPSNQSGESYILNFDYYYNQGLLNREEAEEDRISFLSKAANLNKQIQEQELKRRELEAALVEAGSKRNVYTELVESAQETKTETLEDFEELTGLSYEQYVEKHKQLIDGIFITDEPELNIIEESEQEKVYSFVLTETPKLDSIVTVNIPQYEWTSSFKNEGKIVNISTTYGDFTPHYVFNGDKSFTLHAFLDQSIESIESVIIEYEAEQDEQLTEEETILETLGALYTSSAVINNYSGLLTNANKEYWDIRRQLRGSENYTIKYWTVIDANSQRHVVIEVSDFIAGISFQLGNSIEEQTTVSKRRFDFESEETTITFTVPEEYVLKPAQNVYTIKEQKIAVIELNSINSEDGVEDKIEKLQQQKDELTNTFNNKYSRYIQEGTWNSTDYIDSELYYLDALQVSNTSAQPVISYTINVVEVSELDGLEDYLFDTGDKTYIEDTEFFGWSLVNIGTEEQPVYVKTPAHEEVIVSEVEWHLDEPESNVITIQNYKTRFEDLFQRISAAVQTVQYNEATYAKISTLLDADGTINQNVLTDSLNRIKGKEVALTTDGSIQIHGDEIVIHNNLTNNNNFVILNSEGIKVSSNGQTWQTAISGEGINVGAVFTGTLNTNNVIIGNSDNPSFRWDKAGISAFKSIGHTTEIGGESVESYDLQTFVRYDQYGLYGIKNNRGFKAQSLDDVKDNAHFAVTWDGFFIKNSYTGGGRVSLTSDNDFQVINTVNGEENEKIKIGALEWGKDGQGNPITTPQEGVTPTLYGIRINNDAGQTVMKTGDDGNLEITGTIYANAGEIGGMSVDNDRMTMKYIVFEPEMGIYSTYPYLPNTPEASTVLKPFIISDTDGSATFNNVIVRGSIKTSVFEYEEIQAVGGAFLFRPSSSVRNAVVEGNNIVFTVEKIGLFKVGDYLKVSNFSSETVEDEVTPDELNGFGLTYVYPVGAVNGRQVTLTGAATMLATLGIAEEDLIGGSLIDMGRHATEVVNGIIVDAPGNNNYGIGINSSDGFINLPPRAISLFETVIHPNQDPKVSYRYRGILGTLPNLLENPLDVNTAIYSNMQDTQGIYTDNMYIGDSSQYVAFYTDKNDNNKKKLKIQANQIMFEVVDETTGETDWQDISDVTQGADGQDAITVEIDSTAGNLFVNDIITSTLICTVRKGGVDITNNSNYSIYYTWKKRLSDGSGYDPNWGRPLEHGNRINITSQDVENKGIFECEVIIQEV